jgi:hypothetical protein
MTPAIQQEHPMSKRTSKTTPPDVLASPAPPARSALVAEARGLLARWTELGVRVGRAFDDAAAIGAAGATYEVVRAAEEAANAITGEHIRVESQLAALCMGAMGLTAADLDAIEAAVGGEHGIALVLDGHVLAIGSDGSGGYSTELLTPELVLVLA